MSRAVGCLLTLLSMFFFATSASAQMPSFSPAATGSQPPAVDPFLPAPAVPASYEFPPQAAPPLPPYTNGLPSIQPPSYGGSPVGRDCANQGRCGSGFVGGVEVPVLRPFVSGGLSSINNSSNSHFHPTMRLWLGYQGPEGLGGRIRYWNFNNTTNNSLTQLGFDFQTIDAELTQAVNFHRWNLLFAGGIRYASTSLDATGVFTNSSVTTNWDGVGITLAAQASRDLNSSGSWRFLAGGRWSNLFGNGNVTTVSTSGATTDNSIRNDLISILELNVGPQYRYRFPNGMNLTAYVGGEAQYWSNAIDYGFPNRADVGFAGVTSSIGVTY